MSQVLLFLHFVGLMLGATGGFGSALVMRRALAVGPEAARPLRELGPMLANVSATGLALMWASGLVLVWSRWNGPGGLPELFWLKFLFVLTLTAATIAIHLTYAEIRRGNRRRRRGCRSSGRRPGSRRCWRCWRRSSPSRAEPTEPCAVPRRAPI